MAKKPESTVSRVLSRFETPVKYVRGGVLAVSLLLVLSSSKEADNARSRYKIANQTMPPLVPGPIAPEPIPPNYILHEDEMDGFGRQLPFADNLPTIAEQVRFIRDQGIVVCENPHIDDRAVQLLYVRRESTASQMEELAPLIRHAAIQVDGIFDASAQLTGGSRHIKFATISPENCVISVKEVAIPDDTPNDFGEIVAELQRASNISSHRNFIGFMPEWLTICGKAFWSQDLQKGPENSANYMGFSIVGGICTTTPEVIAHELLHTLGAVAGRGLDGDGNAIVPPGSDSNAHLQAGNDLMAPRIGVSSGDETGECSNPVYATLADACDAKGGHAYFAANPSPEDTFLRFNWNPADSLYFTRETLTGELYPHGRLTSEHSLVPTGLNTTTFLQLEITGLNLPADPDRATRQTVKIGGIKLYANVVEQVYTEHVLDGSHRTLEWPVPRDLQEDIVHLTAEITFTDDFGSSFRVLVNGPLVELVRSRSIFPIAGNH